MTERELFEAIGQVDDDLILAADAPAKKRRKPPVYWRNFAAAAACACVFLGGVAVWQSDAFRKNSAVNETSTMAANAPEAAAAEAAPDDEPLLSAAAPQEADGAEADEGSAAKSSDTAESSIALGVARCVQIGGVRSFESPALSDFAADRDADGVIEDSVERDVFPETDGCSNFGAGYSYWLTGDKTIVVEIDGEYLLFEAN